MVSIEEKGGLMSKIVILAIVLVAITTMSCFADQLAWNSRGTCEEAVKSIGQGSILLSYCSLCSNDHVEVWLVRGIIVSPTVTQGLFEVNVLGKRLYRSNEAFQESDHSEAVEYQAVTGEEPARRFITSIDLAYVYVSASDGSFRALGKVIKRECSINVDTISLPPKLLQQAKRQVQRESGKEMLTW